ncbi:unnamed protein product, partial [Ixodes hexagonus]
PSIVFVVLSQENDFSAAAAKLLSQSIQQQAAALSLGAPIVYLAHEHWPDVLGSWTIFPLLERLHQANGGDSQWFFFCEDTTQLDLGGLVNLLDKYNCTDDHFLGHALWDVESTIIHHFDDPMSLAYPAMSAGVVLSVSTLSRAATAWTQAASHEFSIDRQYEFAKFLRTAECGALILENVSSFCLGQEKGSSCITWSPWQAPSCGHPAARDAVLVAVKTCGQFHEERVPLVKATWVKDAGRVVFFSDVEDSNIPTVTVGVSNVQRGHCAKTMAILKHILSNGLLDVHTMWLVVADDDTLLSMPRLLDLLGCFNAEDEIALGERYGFGTASGLGYDYLTGGSGMVFTKKTVERIVHSQCSCPSDDSPDDMLLGACLQRLGIPLTHSPLFHQARPDDYSSALLSHQRPISFHKFWMMDPIETYRRWLVDVPTNGSQHDEL